VDECLVLQYQCQGGFVKIMTHRQAHGKLRVSRQP
jgi:hypothetical protein